MLDACLTCEGLNYQDCEVLFRSNKQISEIAGCVHLGNYDFNVACSGTPSHTRHSCMEEVSTVWCHSRVLGELDMDLGISCMGQECFLVQRIHDKSIQWIHWREHSFPNLQGSRGLFLSTP